MSDIFFQDLEIPEPQAYLGVNSSSHGAMTGQMLEKIECILIDYRPNWVLVYGDTNSTLAGALASAKLHIPVAHVEAGLRSFNRKMPEEVNRILTDHISNLLFCPTKVSVKNLAAEGILDGVTQVGDVMYDAFLFYKHQAERSSAVLKEFGLKKKGYCLATVHREENTEDPFNLQSILAALMEISAPERPVVFPMHPRTRKNICLEKTIEQSGDGLRIIAPVGYFDMITLETNAFAIITDSGGVQKEAFFSQVPCITLREETEWVETIESGWNALAGTDKKEIVRIYKKLAATEERSNKSYYGDGDAAKKIIQKLIQYDMHTQ